MTIELVKIVETEKIEDHELKYKILKMTEQPITKVVVDVAERTIESEVYKALQASGVCMAVLPKETLDMITYQVRDRMLDHLSCEMKKLRDKLRDEEE